jgi:hypothetical protein
VNVLRGERVLGTESIADVATKIYRKFEEFLVYKEEQRAAGIKQPTLDVLERNLDQILEWVSQLPPETHLWTNPQGKFVTALDYQKDLYRYRMARLMPAKIEVAPTGENPVVTRDELTRQALVGLPTKSVEPVPSDPDLEDEQ